MTYISDQLRRLIIKRANFQCEYCLLHEDDSIKRHEIDHIYAEKHGGATTDSNLCYSCITCNRYKGSDLASIDPQTGEIVPLFHPRNHVWNEHFKLDGARIEPLTPTGRVTVFLLHLNDEERLIERSILINLKRYPR